MSRLRVVVLFGGRSVEREVSRISARTIVGALDPARYEVFPLAIAENGRFLTAEASAGLLTSGPAPAKYRLPEKTSPGDQALVPSEMGPGRADVVFPIIHGTTGEDGALQGFLELLDIPYVGAGVTASAIGMDKAVFKALLRDAGLPTPRAVVVTAAQVAKARGRVEALGIRLPLFVKPSAGGSSVGVSKVKTWGALASALDLALGYDERALVEEGIDARELECAVLGNSEP